MKKFTLSEITGIAEIVGSIGIIVSLIFVGLQVRQNTHQVESASYQALSNFVRAVNALGNTPQTADLVRRGFDDFQALSEDEKVQFDGMMGGLASYFAEVAQRYQQGTLSAQEYESLQRLFAQVFLSPGVKEWWTYGKRTFPQQYQALYDDILKRHPDVQPWSEHLKFEP
jgi:hypothetical protein